MNSMPQNIEVLPRLFGAPGDAGTVFRLLAGLIQLVRELADGGKEGVIGGGVIFSADAAGEKAGFPLISVGWFTP